MCGHHYMLDRRPAGGEGWEELERFDFEAYSSEYEEARAAAEARARRIAASYALAEPERAGELVLQLYDCCGPAGDPIPAPLPPTLPDQRQLAAEVVRLRQALKPYAAIELGERRNGRLHLSLPADGGAGARTALRDDEEAE
jgi:hypothetical protein